jgi:hypothetical protein
VAATAGSFAISATLEGRIDDDGDVSVAERERAAEDDVDDVESRAFSFGADGGTVALARGSFCDLGEAGEDGVMVAQAGSTLAVGRDDHDGVAAEKGNGE